MAMFIKNKALPQFIELIRQKECLNPIQRMQYNCPYHSSITERTAVHTEKAHNKWNSNICSLLAGMMSLRKK